MSRRALLAGIALPAIVGGLGMIEGAQAAAPRVIPAPASLEARDERPFALARDTRIVVRDHSRQAKAVGDFLGGILRRSTGYPLPVGRNGSGGRIELDLTHDRRLGSEGYELKSDRHRVRLRARTPEGLFRGVQTLRQLLPGRVESASVQPGPWTIPAVEIEDEPRFGWRGAMLDVSRHFFSIPEVKRYLDLLTMYKVNTLHLHLADDQGWRIAIDSWPRLTEVGGSLEVGGTPGGFYTKDDYREILRYAAERYITIVPEIDTPGHTNAALASYADLNCDGVAPPLYTGTNVGFSSLCIDKELTYRFLDDVVGELAELTPGPYLHLGGDEAHSTSDEDYLQFMERAEEIVHAHGKRLLGWGEIAKSPLRRDSVAQHWSTATGSEEGTELARAAVAQGVKLVMSPAHRVYLDMKYTRETPLGLTWAGLVEVKDSYEWDPATLVDGVGEDDVLGVEAPLWSETITNGADIEFMAFPRLPGAAEIGWSPAAGRSWDEYRTRLAAQAPRWEALDVNFYRSPQVPWP